MSKTWVAGKTEMIPKPGFEGRPMNKHNSTQREVKGHWVQASPEDKRKRSEVAYTKFRKLLSAAQNGAAILPEQIEEAIKIPGSTDWDEELKATEGSGWEEEDETETTFDSLYPEDPTAADASQTRKILDLVPLGQQVPQGYGTGESLLRDGLIPMANGPQEQMPKSPEEIKQTLDLINQDISISLI